MKKIWMNDRIHRLSCWLAIQSPKLFKVFEEADVL